MGNSNLGLDDKYLNSFSIQWVTVRFSLAVIMQEVEVTIRNFAEIKEAGFKMNLKLEYWIVH